MNACAEGEFRADFEMMVCGGGGAEKKEGVASQVVIADPLQPSRSLEMSECHKKT
jgi:hypothetical protein